MVERGPGYLLSVNSWTRTHCMMQLFFISDNGQCGTWVQREMHEVSSVTTWLSVGSQGEAGRGGRPTEEGGRQRGDLAHCEDGRQEGIPHP